MLGQSIEERNCRAEATGIMETTEERMDEAELLHRVPGDLLNAAGNGSRGRAALSSGHCRCGASERKALSVEGIDSLARLWRDRANVRKPVTCSGRIYTGSPKALMRRT